ncbi:MAG: ECF transporter S component [Clostridia bacterium]|nr:ECF transporter S component [Clostridia bacterium]
MKKETIRGIAVSGIMGAIGFILMMLEFPLAFLIPSFVKLDFSELPALIAAFAFGPLYGVLVCLVKNLLHLFITSSAGVGELSNFLMGAIFVGVAGWIYQANKSKRTAFLGALIGTLTMAAISVLTNYYIVYPAYVVLYGMPMEAIIGMYQAILPKTDTLLKALLIFNLPFNVGKGLLNTLLCMAIYKRISPLLKYGKSKNNS